jgi:transposase
MIHSARGDSLDYCPDLNQVMLDLMVVHQAGMPLRMKPLSGHRRDGQNFGQIVTEHITPLQTTYGTTYLVADRALDSEENL